MNISLYKSFNKSFSKLTDEDQNRVFKTMIDIDSGNELNGLRLHKVGNFYSYSVTMNLRIIASLEDNKKILWYVSDHDDAYNWANKNIPVKVLKKSVGYVESDYVNKEEKEVENHKFDYLLEFGFDEGFINYLCSLSEEQFIDALEHISPEYQEIILNSWEYDINLSLMTPSNILILTDDSSMKLALSLDVENWMIYLHPQQKYIRDMPLSNNIILKGGPGTGKTVSLLHRFNKAYRESLKTGCKKPLFICFNQVTKDVVEKMLRRFQIENCENYVVILDKIAKDKNASKLSNYLSEYSIVFIDEAQDIPVGILSKMVMCLENGLALPPINFALDINQSMFSSVGESFERLTPFFDNITLTYCYRSTKQIIDIAKEMLKIGEASIKPKDFQNEYRLKSSFDTISSGFTAVLSGPEVKTICFQNTDDLLQILETICIELTGLYNDKKSWSIILIPGDDWGKQTDIYKILLKIYHENVITVDNVKGKEYFAGIIIDLQPKSSNPISTVAQYKQSVIKPYVALTRCRDRAYYLKGM